MGARGKQVEGNTVAGPPPYPQARSFTILLCKPRRATHSSIAHPPLCIFVVDDKRLFRAYDLPRLSPCVLPKMLSVHISQFPSPAGARGGPVGGVQLGYASPGYYYLGAALQAVRRRKSSGRLLREVRHFPQNCVVGMAAGLHASWCLPLRHHQISRVPMYRFLSDSVVESPENTRMLAGKRQSDKLVRAVRRASHPPSEMDCT